MIQSFECREGRQTQELGRLKNIKKQKIKGDEQESDKSRTQIIFLYFLDRRTQDQQKSKVIQVRTMSKEQRSCREELVGGKEKQSNALREIYSVQESKSVILWLCAHPSLPRPPPNVHTNMHIRIYTHRSSVELRACRPPETLFKKIDY